MVLADFKMLLQVCGPWCGETRVFLLAIVAYKPVSVLLSSCIMFPYFWSCWEEPLDFGWLRSHFVWLINSFTFFPLAFAAIRSLKVTFFVTGLWSRDDEESICFNEIKKIDEQVKTNIDFKSIWTSININWISDQQEEERRRTYDWLLERYDAVEWREHRLFIVAICSDYRVESRSFCGN